MEHVELTTTNLNHRAGFQDDAVLLGSVIRLATEIQRGTMKHIVTEMSEVRSRVHASFSVHEPLHLGTDSVVVTCIRGATGWR